MKNSTISFKYQFTSGIGYRGEARYISNIKMEIFSEDEFGNQPKIIGMVNFKIVYIAQAINVGYNLISIFDVDEYTFRHAQEFFDFETDEIKEDIQRFYDYELLSSNICILERVEILPEYRGNKIAAKATKDIIFHFGSGCGLFVIQVFPLQLETREKDKWQEQLKLDNFLKDRSAAFKNLRNYYKSWGFDEISGYNELLFLNTAHINDKLNLINLDE